MSIKRIAWLREDEAENIKVYGLDFSRAREEERNALFLKIAGADNEGN